MDRREGGRKAETGRVAPGGPVRLRKVAKEMTCRISAVMFGIFRCRCPAKGRYKKDCDMEVGAATAFLLVGLLFAIVTDSRYGHTVTQSLTYRQDP
jgi:hypothetical protein